MTPRARLLAATLAAPFLAAPLLPSAVLAQDDITQTEETSGPRGDARRGGGVNLPDKYLNENIHMGYVSTDAAFAACPQDGYDQLLCLADGLKANLSDDVLAELQLDYSVEDAQKWSNFPPLGYQGRVGPTLGDFDESQLAYLKALLQTAMGDAAHEGYDELEELLNLDDYLIQETGEKGFSSSNFQVAFLGKPATTGTWELQYGGHHTAVSNTYVDGVLVSATPSFRGAEPFGATQMNGRENDPMTQEWDAFRAMLGGLDAEQIESAELAQTYSDVVVGPQKDDNFPTEKEGIAVSELDDTQKALVLDAVQTYVGDIAAPDAEDILATYAEQLDETYIGWSGASDLNSSGAYVRLDGPRLWIEFSMQPGRSLPGIHPHSVWRDREMDYAGNLD